MATFRITFSLDLFNGEQNRAASFEALEVMLRNLVELNMIHLRHHPQTPWLYESGVRYMEEPPGQEDWNDIPTVLRLGISDCEDLCAWRCAELRVRQGVDAKCIFRTFPRPDGGVLYHIQVQYPDGKIEDPSKILGMR